MYTFLYIFELNTQEMSVILGHSIFTSFYRLKRLSTGPPVFGVSQHGIRAKVYDNM